MIRAGHHRGLPASRGARSLIRSLRLASWLGLSTFCVAVLGVAPSARACAPCGAGDPSIVPLGYERPNANSVRILLDAQQLSFDTGGARITDRRLLVGAAWSPWERVSFIALMPLVARHVAYANLASDIAWSPGDTEVRARLVVWRDRSFAPSTLVSVQLGANIPSSPLLGSAEGPMPLDVQVGTGSLDPMFGLSWVSRLDDTISQLSLLGTTPTPGFGGVQRGLGLRGSWLLQWQPLHEVALLTGTDFRVEDDSMQGAMVFERGGGIAFAVVGLALRGLHDTLTFTATVRVPVIQSLDGGRRHDDSIVSVSALIDL